MIFTSLPPYMFQYWNMFQYWKMFQHWIGMGLGWDWYGIGMGLGWDWDGIGMGLGDTLRGFRGDVWGDV